MTTIELRHRLLRCRAGVFAMFGAFGLVVATWAAHLPAVKAATGASASMIGVALFILGAGALAGMQLAGVLVDRVGPVPVGLSGVAAMAVTLVAPLAVHTWALVAAGALALGLSTGVAEVGMNAVAVEVERGYQRSIMAAFHAVFSIGNVCGAGLAAAGFALAVGTVSTAVCVSVIALTLVATAAWLLVRNMPGSPADSQTPLPL